MNRFCRDEWFNQERYEYLVNWLHADTKILSYPTPNHPAHIAIKAWVQQIPEIIVPYLIEELMKSHSRYGRATWNILEILHTTIPDAPRIPDESRGRRVEMVLLWEKWYAGRTILDEHNMEKYVHKLPA